MPKNHKYKDETGNKYAMLTMVKNVGKNKHGKYMWECLCDCGNVCVVVGGDIRSGQTQSCGCNWVKHGLSSHPIYHSWCAAKKRCVDKKDKSYNNYGGRGIEFKLGSAQEFAKRMLPSWVEGSSLDRKDNEGHYEYENIKWSTPIEQARNKRTNVLIEFQGREMILAEWARELGFSACCLSNRIENWGVEKAMTTPLNVKHRRNK